MTTTPDLFSAADRPLALVAPETQPTGAERLGALLVLAGIAVFGAALAGLALPGAMTLLAGFGLVGGGAALVFRRNLRRDPSSANDGLRHSTTTARGWSAWLLGVGLTAFYVAVYWFPETLTGLTAAFDPLSRALRGQDANQWFLYSTFYTFAVVVMGVRALLRYRGSRYHMLRTVSVMAFQTLLAWALPALLVRLQQPELYFHYTWPLDYDFLWPSSLAQLQQQGTLGLFFLVWGVALIAVVTPVLTYFYGKRWYCAWVCGCGGLAETAGDPFRHLSDKSLRAWKVERWLVHGILAFIVLVTILLAVRAFTGVGAGLADRLAGWYGFFIGAVFAGVIGVGFYPLMGARVWCRFGCPMAAILGLQQRFFSRFRITTNGGQCISCGNCSTYCEMGIDVRHYAQRGQNVVRAACVGCGVCAHVCPRGVLRLENGPPSQRTATVFVHEADLLMLEDEWTQA
jgi:ferredoxin-type protein NapH